MSSTSITSSSKDKRAGFVLVHGSWHGSWCWAEVASLLEKQGYPCVAVDLPGSGLKAVSPKSYFKRPLNNGKFASDVSYFSNISGDEFADSVIDGAKQLQALGVEKIIAVGHSMGGLPVTMAAAKAPALFSELVFLTAFTAVPNKPAGAYLQLPKQEQESLLGALLLADPEIIGGLRIDTSSTDEIYRENVKQALAEDVNESLWNSAVNMMSPDAPFAIYGEVIEFTGEYGSIGRTFIRCTKDKSLVPSTQDALIEDLNAAWPENTCKVMDLDVSHEAMFAAPHELAVKLRVLV